MTTKTLVPLALLVAPGLALAQADTDAKKSAEQITCELTRECAVEAEPATPQLRQKGKQRGFNIDKRSAKESKKEPAYAARSTGQKPSGVSGTAGKGPTKAVKATGKSGSDNSAGGSARLAVGFDTGSATFDASGRRQAAALLAALKGPKLIGRRIVVSGHTDNVGDRATNLELSLRRAQALVDYLTQNGIDRTTLEAKGYGFDQPLPGLSPRAPANRRVEIALAN